MRVYIIVLHLLVVALATVLLVSTVGRGARSVLRTSPVYVQVEYGEDLREGRIQGFSLWVNEERIAYLHTIDGQPDWVQVLTSHHPWSWAQKT